MVRDLPGFLVAAVVIALVPGPATALVIRQTLRSGRRGAVCTATGDAAGIVLWALAAGGGVVALLAASDVAYDGLRLVGAVVLVWLGVRSMWPPRRAQRLKIEAGALEPLRSARAVWAGLLSNLANPKAAVFAFAFYPQFLRAERSPLTAALLLAVIQAAIEIGWYMLLATFVHQLRRVIGSSGFRRRLEQLMGAVLVALGIRLALELP
ncbi:MAG: LysE family translocator [Pseudonocardiaceae bacterium]